MGGINNPGEGKGVARGREIVPGGKGGARGIWEVEGRGSDQKLKSKHPCSPLSLCLVFIDQSKLTTLRLDQYLSKLLRFQNLKSDKDFISQEVLVLFVFYFTCVSAFAEILQSLQCQIFQ